MLVITQKIRNILKRKNLSENKLAQMIGYHSGSLNKMINGKKPFPDDKIEKIASVLGVPGDEIRGWALAGKYSQETIKRALQLQKEHAKSGKKVTTIKMHELMDANSLNVCRFAIALGYNQGWLSQVILGNESISKKLIPKLTAFSGFSEDEILSWLVADRYPAKILRLAMMS